jgi:hypothetical protein
MNEMVKALSQSIHQILQLDQAKIDGEKPAKITTTCLPQNPHELLWN